MSDSEVEIMRYFRRFDVRVGQMLFFDTGPQRADAARFYQAIESLIQRGLVVEERPHCAYSLTRSGYRASLSA
jgi:hypothetical protein